MVSSKQESEVPDKCWLATTSKGDTRIVFTSHVYKQTLSRSLSQGFNLMLVKEQENE